MMMMFQQRMILLCVWSWFCLLWSCQGLDDEKWLCCSKDDNDKCKEEEITSCNCKDRVYSIPGWNQPLPSPWYSGLLTYEFQGRIIHTHYILVLAEFDAEYARKPLIYWSNGGPGASSMFGLLTELGPLLWNQLSKETDEYRITGIPTPIYNPYSWTKLGHLLIFDQPAPVGFSFCEMANQTSSKSSIMDCAGLAWTDELAAQNSFRALQTFFQKYPGLLKRDLYLTGESYAGIYIPTLAREILNTQAAQNFSLRGFAVGDGCLGTRTGICGNLDPNSKFDFWLMLFLAGHNQIPLHTFLEIIRACKPFQEDHSSNDNDICNAIVDKAFQQVGGFYAYGLYDECTYSNGLMRQIRKQLQQQQQGLPLKGALNDYPCGGDLVMEEYLELDIVRKAFHVQDLDFFSGDNANGFAYTPTEPDLTGFYQQVVLDTPLRVLVYNGDVDPAITSFATQNWTSHLGLKTLQEWRPWTVDACRRMGGYVVRYQGDFDFLTVRGSGHMVPTNKPAATFTFLKAWLTKQDYPPYIFNCTAPPPASEYLMRSGITNQESVVAAIRKKNVRVAV